MGSLFEDLPSRQAAPTSSSRYNAVHYPEQIPWNPHRPVKIIIVGGGIGGIAAAVLLSGKVPNASISLYDRQDKVGGTWALNVYPGVRCDVPSHSYQLSFSPNTNWSEYYPKGAEIQQYYEQIVEKYGLKDSVHHKRECVRATWLSEANQWSIEIKNLETGGIFIETADFFVSSQGRISVPKYPLIQGLYDGIFNGQVVHTAKWPKNLDIEGKRVAVIGCGASGQQLVPNILNRVAHLDHYVRGKTWVTATFGAGLYEATPDAPGGPLYSEEQRAECARDEVAYLEYRRMMDLTTQKPPGFEVMGSELNAKGREAILATMRRRLNNDEEWLKRVVPDYAPGCKRLTPAPGYLEALQTPKVDYVDTAITHVDATGIWTSDGKHREVDIIITATGFEMGFTSHFPVIGRDGVDIRDKWSDTGPIGYPESYLGVMAPGYPNYFTILQAQGNSRGGTVPLQCELSAAFIARCIRKIQGQSYVSLEPKQDAAEDFNDVANSYFQDKVLRDSCNSWFKVPVGGKGDARVTIGWPGTYHHRAKVLRDPRWEDFEFKRKPGSEKNRYEYFGDGTTEREVGDTRDEANLTRYLRVQSELDPATVHELWND